MIFPRHQQSVVHHATTNGRAHLPAWKTPVRSCVKQPPATFPFSQARNNIGRMLVRRHHAATSSISFTPLAIRIPQDALSSSAKYQADPPTDRALSVRPVITIRRRVKSASAFHCIRQAEITTLRYSGVCLRLAAAVQRFLPPNQWCQQKDNSRHES